MGGGGFCRHSSEDCCFQWQLEGHAPRSPYEKCRAKYDNLPRRNIWGLPYSSWCSRNRGHVGDVIAMQTVPEIHCKLCEEMTSWLHVTWLTNGNLRSLYSRNFKQNINLLLLRFSMTMQTVKQLSTEDQWLQFQFSFPTSWRHFWSVFNRNRRSSGYNSLGC
jgi:hypothetical protein